MHPSLADFRHVFLLNLDHPSFLDALLVSVLQPISKSFSFSLMSISWLGSAIIYTMKPPNSTAGGKITRFSVRHVTLYRHNKFVEDTKSKSLKSRTLLYTVRFLPWCSHFQESRKRYPL